MKFIHRTLLQTAVLFFILSAQLSCRMTGSEQTAPAVETSTPVTIQTEVTSEPEKATALAGNIPLPEPLITQTTDEKDPAEPFGQPARRWLEEIVGLSGPRPAGSDAERKAGDYIASELESMGYAVDRQPFSIESDSVRTIHSANIMAVKKGLSDGEIIVGAHYDSGDEGDGADDNASGVAVLLETARRLKNFETPHTVRFIAFGAEETGLNGSSHYVNSLQATELKQISYMVNLDSLIAGEIAYVYGDADFKGNLRDMVLKEARRLGFDLEGKTAEELDPPDQPCECSDYYPFKQAGIPYIYFESTNWNRGDMDGWTQVDEDLGDNGMIWHTPYDTITYIDRIAPERIDEHLELYTRLLFEGLKEYSLPD